MISLWRQCTVDAAQVDHPDLVKTSNQPLLIFRRLLLLTVCLGVKYYYGSYKEFPL
jgi:hypothetical protein